MRCELYTDAGGKYRWRLISSNGQTTASSGESFSSAGGARTAAENFVSKCATWNFEVYADKGGSHRCGEDRFHFHGDMLVKQFPATLLNWREVGVALCKCGFRRPWLYT